MRAVASLGSSFFAFVAGAIVAAGTTVVITIFLSNSLPSFWWVLLLSGVALTVSSAFLLRLTVRLSSLEIALASIPFSIDFSERQEVADQMIAALRKSTYFAIVLSIFFAAGGVALLPTRLALIKADIVSVDHHTRRMGTPRPDNRGVADTPSSLGRLDAACVRGIFLPHSRHS